MPIQYSSPIGPTRGGGILPSAPVTKDWQSSNQSNLQNVTPSAETVTNRGTSGGGGSRQRQSSVSNVTQSADVVQEQKQAIKEILTPKTQTYRGPQLPNNQYQNYQMVTSQTLAPTIKKDYQVQIQPYLKKDFTGYITDEETGRQIPTYSEVKYVDPTVMGKQFERTATQEESSYYNQQNKVVNLEKPTSKPVRIAGEIYGKGKQLLYEANKTGKQTLETIGYTDKNIDIMSSTVARANPISLIPGGKKFVESAIGGALKDVRDKPFTNVGLYLASAGLGAAAEGLPIAVRWTTKAAGFTGIVSKAEKVAKIGTVGTGIVLTGGYAAQKGGQLLVSKSAEERGNIFGTTIKDVGIIGFGYSGGSKLARYVEGKILTRGRKFIDTKQGEYPQAPVNKQLNLFQKNVIPEFGNKPGAYHTTSDTFWTKSIEPKAGTSEVPGLYASTQVSTPFSKIPGSGETGLIPRTIKQFKEMFSTGSPGIAFLKPEGFRYVKAVKIPGRPSKPLGYSWTAPAREGFMDIPKVKSEIEAIARPEAGNYAFESGQYYTEIKGIPVKIDVFKFDKTIKTGNKGQIVGGSGDYSLIKTTSLAPKVIDIYPSVKSKTYQVIKSSSSAKSSNVLGSSTASSSKPIIGSSGSYYRPSRAYSSGSSVTSSLTSGVSSRSGISSNITSSIRRSLKSYASGSSASRYYGYNPSKIPPLFPKLKTDNKKRTFDILKRTQNKFITLLRRQGKFKQIAVSPTPQTALSKGLVKARTTLGASIIVRNVKTGRPVRFLPPRDFYSQKKNPSILVQRRKFRLSSRSEVGEIQAARRKSTFW